jgi:hypothetical protein
MEKKKKPTWGPNDASGIICACFHCHCPTVAIVIRCYTHRLRKKKGKKKRHKNSGGEDRPTIVLVIGTMGQISFDRINDVIKVY